MLRGWLVQEGIYKELKALIEYPKKHDSISEQGIIWKKSFLEKLEKDNPDTENNKDIKTHWGQRSL